jgi:hypothetical protein
VRKRASMVAMKCIGRCPLLRVDLLATVPAGVFRLQ